MTYSHVDQLSKTLKWVFIVKRGGPPLQVFEARCSDQFEGLREWKKIHSFQLTFSLLFSPCLIFLFLDPFDGSRADRIGEFRPTRLVSGAEHELPSANTKRQMQKKYGYDTNTYIYQQIFIRQINYKHTQE